MPQPFDRVFVLFDDTEKKTDINLQTRLRRRP